MSRQQQLLFPLVSIVMTVYNRQQYLAAAIQSILNSDYRQFELIIWDDGSIDNSLSIARSYARQNRRIKLIAAPHQGRGLALQKAIEITKGKYLGLVDSDDKLHEEAISKTVDYLEANPNTGMVYTDCLLIDEGDKVIGLDRRSLIPYSPQRLLIDFMTFHFRLFRRNIYDLVNGFNPNLESVEDYDLCLRFSEVTTIQHLQEPLYFYRQHQNSFSGECSLKQAYYTELAIEQALTRRGLADCFSLEVKAKPKFFLQRKIKVANKVFGIGLSLTKQRYLTDILNLLGIPTIYCPFNLSKIDSFDGATDLPIALNYQKLDRLYPHSKFILTIRNIQHWLRDFKRQKLKLEQKSQEKLLARIEELEIKCYGTSKFDASLWMDVYDRHFVEVTDYFRDRERDLLIINLFEQKDYQQKIQDFLGCSDREF